MKQHFREGENAKNNIVSEIDEMKRGKTILGTKMRKLQAFKEDPYIQEIQYNDGTKDNLVSSFIFSEDSLTQFLTNKTKGTLVQNAA